eukprot:5206290-Ditylum_brightwellii.AAC.1
MTPGSVVTPMAMISKRLPLQQYNILNGKNAMVKFIGRYWSNAEPMKYAAMPFYGCVRKRDNGNGVRGCQR